MSTIRERNVKFSFDQAKDNICLIEETGTVVSCRYEDSKDITGSRIRGE